MPPRLQMCRVLSPEFKAAEGFFYSKEDSKYKKQKNKRKEKQKKVMPPSCIM